MVGDAGGDVRGEPVREPCGKGVRQPGEEVSDDCRGAPATSRPAPVVAAVMPRFGARGGDVRRQAWVPRVQESMPEAEPARV